MAYHRFIHVRRPSYAGSPFFKETDVTIAEVLRLMSRGVNDAEILNRYAGTGITTEHLGAAREYAASTVEGETQPSIEAVDRKVHDLDIRLRNGLWLLAGLGSVVLAFFGFTTWKTIPDQVSSQIKTSVASKVGQEFEKAQRDIRDRLVKIQAADERINKLSTDVETESDSLRVRLVRAEQAIGLSQNLQGLAVGRVTLSGDSGALWPKEKKLGVGVTQWVTFPATFSRNPELMLGPVTYPPSFKGRIWAYVEQGKLYPNGCNIVFQTDADEFPPSDQVYVSYLALDTPPLGTANTIAEGDAGTVASSTRPFTPTTNRAP